MVVDHPAIEITKMFIDVLGKICKSSEEKEELINNYQEYFNKKESIEIYRGANPQIVVYDENEFDQGGSSFYDFHTQYKLDCNEKRFQDVLDKVNQYEEEIETIKSKFSRINFSSIIIKNEFIDSIKLLKTLIILKKYNIKYFLMFNIIKKKTILLVENRWFEKIILLMHGLGMLAIEPYKSELKNDDLLKEFISFSIYDLNNDIKQIISNSSFLNEDFFLVLL